MNIVTKKQMGEFILRLIDIREDLERTPRFDSDILLTPTDIKNIILKKNGIFGITNQIGAKSKVIEMLNSIKNDWKFTTSNKIEKGVMFIDEKTNGEIGIIGYQTEILDLYSSQVLGVKRKKKIVKTTEVEFNNDLLSYDGKGVPMARGQGRMCELFYTNAKIIGGKKPQEGASLSVGDIRITSGYKTGKSFRDALKKMREKLEVFSGMITVDNTGTQMYQMCIDYSK